MTVCSRKGCKAEAGYGVVALLYPAGPGFDPDVPCELAISLPLCKAHADEVDFTDKDWRPGIEKAAEHMCLAPIDADRTGKTIVPVDDFDVWQQAWKEMGAVNGTLH